MREIEFRGYLKNSYFKGKVIDILGKIVALY